MGSRALRSKSTGQPHARKAAPIVQDHSAPAEWDLFDHPWKILKRQGNLRNKWTYLNYMGTSSTTRGLSIAIFDYQRIQRVNELVVEGNRPYSMYSCSLDGTKFELLMQLQAGANPNIGNLVTRNIDAKCYKQRRDICKGLHRYWIRTQYFRASEL